MSTEHRVIYFSRRRPGAYVSWNDVHARRDVLDPGFTSSFTVHRDALPQFFPPGSDAEGATCLCRSVKHFFIAARAAPDWGTFVRACGADTIDDARVVAARHYFDHWQYQSTRHEALTVACRLSFGLGAKPGSLLETTPLRNVVEEVARVAASISEGKPSNATIAAAAARAFSLGTGKDSFRLRILVLLATCDAAMVFRHEISTVRGDEAEWGSGGTGEHTGGANLLGKIFTNLRAEIQSHVTAATVSSAVSTSLKQGSRCDPVLHVPVANTSAIMPSFFPLVDLGAAPPLDLNLLQEALQQARRVVHEWYASRRTSPSAVPNDLPLSVLRRALLDAHRAAGGPGTAWTNAPRSRIVALSQSNFWGDGGWLQMGCAVASTKETSEPCNMLGRVLEAVREDLRNDVAADVADTVVAEADSDPQLRSWFDAEVKLDVEIVSFSTTQSPLADWFSAVSDLLERPPVAVAVIVERLGWRQPEVVKLPTWCRGWQWADGTAVFAAAHNSMTALDVAAFEATHCLRPDERDMAYVDDGSCPVRLRLLFDSPSDAQEAAGIASRVRALGGLVQLSLLVPRAPPPPPYDPDTADSGPANEILQWLYLGSMANATDSTWLLQNGFTHVLNASKVRAFTPPRVKTLFLDIPDIADRSADGGFRIESVFERCFNFIEEVADAYDLAVQDAALNGAVENGPSGGVLQGDLMELLREEQRTFPKILVHCEKGKSRSATIVAAFLMHANGWTKAEALQWVAARRPQIEPNLGFQEALMLKEENDSARSVEAAKHRKLCFRNPGRCLKRSQILGAMSALGQELVTQVEDVVFSNGRRSFLVEWAHPRGRDRALAQLRRLALVPVYGGHTWVTDDDEVPSVVVFR